MLLLFQVVPDTAASLACVRRVATLNNEVLLHIEEGAVVVVVDLAELQEVGTEKRAPVDWYKGSYFSFRSTWLSERGPVAHHPGQG